MKRKSWTLDVNATKWIETIRSATLNGLFAIMFKEIQTNNKRSIEISWKTNKWQSTIQNINNVITIEIQRILTTNETRTRK